MKQLELPLKIKGTFEYSDVPSLKELIEERKTKPKGMKDLSTEMINDLLRLHATGWRI
jgi:hypothetical protein